MSEIKVYFKELLKASPLAVFPFLAGLVESDMFRVLYMIMGVIIIGAYVLFKVMPSKRHEHYFN